MEFLETHPHASLPAGFLMLYGPLELKCFDVRAKAVNDAHVLPTWPDPSSVLGPSGDLSIMLP